MYFGHKIPVFWVIKDTGQCYLQLLRIGGSDQGRLDTEINAAYWFCPEDALNGCA